jgi:hypothetical protein
MTTMIRIATTTRITARQQRLHVVVGKAASLILSKTMTTTTWLQGPSAICPRQQSLRAGAIRNFTFSFAGPRKLDDIIKRDTLEMKSTLEIEDIWLTYHENKVRVWYRVALVVFVGSSCCVEWPGFCIISPCSVPLKKNLMQEGVTGLILPGDQGPKVLERATECPFIVQPVFREGGFFNMIAQFQKPCYFLMAYLQDYNMDPTAASPLLTFSVFDDFVKTKNVSLVRVDILNSNIQESEANKVVKSVLHNYIHEFDSVKTFNKRPKDFDFDDYVSRMSARWKEDDATVIDPSDEPGKS